MKIVRDMQFVTTIQFVTIISDCIGYAASKKYLGKTQEDCKYQAVIIWKVQEEERTEIFDIYDDGWQEWIKKYPECSTWRFKLDSLVQLSQFTSNIPNSY